MADIKLKSVDKNKIGEYIGECRSVMGGQSYIIGIAIVDTIDEATLQVLYRLKRLK